MPEFSNDWCDIVTLKTELKKFERKHRNIVLRPVRVIRVSGRGLGAEREFFWHAWQVTSHPKSPRTPGNEAGSTDQLKIYAWSNFLPRSHVDGAELRLGRRSCVVRAKGATKTYLFRNIALKRIEKRCSASCYILGCCKLRGYWLLIG